MEDDETNRLVFGQMEEDKEKIFELAKIYKKFSEYLQNINVKKNSKDNAVYIISKEFIDIFKEKIEYENSKEYLNENTNEKENLNNFKKILKKYSYEELSSILCADIKLYNDLSDIQEDISKGFDFVNYDFLDKLDFDDNFDDYIAHYYRDKNNILIIFDDKSKLIINEENEKTKYHVMDAPIKKIDNIPEIKKTKTINYFSNKRSKTRKGFNFLKHVSKTLQSEEEKEVEKKED